jgi:hypothetical protein
MQDIENVFLLCTLINVAIAISLMVRFRMQVKADARTEAKAKLTYSWLCVAGGIFSGVLLFFGIAALFDISLGHGEILVAAPVFNLLLSFVSIAAGRIVIGWTPLNW